MIYGLILAAGEGTRFGGPKALAVLEGRTFLQRVHDAARGAGLGTILVVSRRTIGATAALAGDPVVVVNDDPGSDMFESIRLGVDEARQRRAAGVVVLPVDHPLVEAADCAAIARALSDGRIAVGFAEDRRGHPVGVPESAFDALLSFAPSDGGTLRSFLAARRDSTERVAVSPGAFLGVNTPAELEKLKRSAR